MWIYQVYELKNIMQEKFMHIVKQEQLVIKRIWFVQLRGNE